MRPYRKPTLVGWQNTAKVNGRTFAKELGSAVKPIPVSADLLIGLDQTKRLEFLKQWQTALGRK